MKTQLIILLVAAVFFSLGCCSTSGEAKSNDEPKCMRSAEIVMGKSYSIHSDYSSENDLVIQTDTAKMMCIETNNNESLKDTIRHLIRRQVKFSLINYTSKNQAVQVQDGNYMVCLEAKSKSGQWMPVQYWRTSSCGNSYYLERIGPKSKREFALNLPEEGSFSTQLRLKLLGESKFYYSTSFNDKINPCCFIEDSSSFIQRTPIPMPHYKLEKFESFNF